MDAGMESGRQRAHRGPNLPLAHPFSWPHSFSSQGSMKPSSSKYMKSAGGDQTREKCQCTAAFAHGSSHQDRQACRRQLGSQHSMPPALLHPGNQPDSGKRWSKGSVSQVAATPRCSSWASTLPGSAATSSCAAASSASSSSSVGSASSCRCCPSSCCCCSSGSAAGCAPCSASASAAGLLACSCSASTGITWSPAAGCCCSGSAAAPASSGCSAVSFGRSRAAGGRRASSARTLRAHSNACKQSGQRGCYLCEQEVWASQGGRPSTRSM